MHGLNIQISTRKTKVKLFALLISFNRLSAELINVYVVLFSKSKVQETSFPE